MELAAAERLRAAGHEVVTPDLYDGETASTLDEGFAVKNRIGWTTLAERARRYVDGRGHDRLAASPSAGHRPGFAFSGTTRAGPGPMSG